MPKNKIKCSQKFMSFSIKNAAFFLMTRILLFSGLANFFQKSGFEAGSSTDIWH
jgi:hypothetical protein